MRLRYTACIVGALFGFFAPYSAVETFAAQQQSLDSAPEAQFRNWMQALSADGTKVSTDELKYDRSTDTLTITNFALSPPPPAGNTAALPSALTIGHLELKAFSSNTDGTRVTSATADNIIFSLPGKTDIAPAKISHVEISGGFVPSLVAFHADPAKPVTSQIRLLRLLSKANFDAVTVEKLDFETSFSVAQINFGKISAGNISKMALSHLSAILPAVESVDTNAQAKRTLNADSLVLDNVNLDAYLRLFESSAYLAAGSARPWTDFVGNVQLDGAKWENGQLVAEIESAKLGPLKVRQFDENITDIFDNSARDPAYLSQNPASSAKLASAVQGAFAFQAASVTGVNVQVSNPTGKTTASLKGISIANLTAKHLDRLQLDVLNVADAGGNVGFQSLGLQDINLNGEPTSAEQGMRLPTIGRVTALGMNLHVGEMNLGLESLDLAMSYFIASIPTNVQAKLEHIRFPPDQIAAPSVKQALMDLGYKDIDLSIKISGAWQDSASAVAFDSIELKGADIGALSLSGSLTGITRASFEDPRNVFPKEILAGGLQNLRIMFENASLFDRFIALVAKQNNKSVDDLKRLLSSNMPAIMAKISPPQTRNKFILAAVSFVNNPKILQLLTTTSDVTLIKDLIASIPQPYNLPAVLNLDVSANERRQ